MKEPPIDDAVIARSKDSLGVAQTRQNHRH
jgi:hypothetical protein